MSEFPPEPPEDLAAEYSLYAVINGSLLVVCGVIAINCIYLCEMYLAKVQNSVIFYKLIIVGPEN